MALRHYGYGSDTYIYKAKNPDAVVKKRSKRRLASLAKASNRVRKGFGAVLDKMKRLRLRVRVKGLDRLRRQFRCRCFAVPRLPAPSRTGSRKEHYRYHKLAE